VPKKRDTVPYSLWQGRKKVYIGTTNDPDRREGEHGATGLNFDKLKVEGPRRTHDSALEWERDAIERYKQGHGGDPPKYNG
jgi:predicted GIY-YIG superfamily endonuclease